MARSGFISVITGLLLCISATASTFTVTTTEDRKAGSLRWAVEQANAETEVSNIVFDLPAGSVVALDSTIDIYSSMIFDGKSGDGRIEISASDPWYIFFRLKNVELDSVVFRNLNVYEPKLETEPYSYLKHNGFAEIDTTAGLLSIKDCHLSKFQDMVIVRGDRIDINVANCLCDTMLYDFFACDMVAYNYTSWSSLVIDNSKFIHTRRGGDLHNGGSVKNTTLHKFTNVYAEDIYGFSYGQAAKNVWENCTFYKLKHAAIDLGCDNRCISEILVNNCKFIECGYYGFHYTLDGSNVVFTNNIVYGSGEQDFFCARDYFTNHAGTLRIENNIFGDANHKNTGLITDATNTIIRNNVIYGTNAICNYMSDDTFKEYSFAIFDQGSDTLLIENNLFGTDNEQFIPNEHGDIWLESEWLLDDWRYYGWFNDYDYNLVPQITVKGNTFMRSSPKAIRIDSAKINITFTENIFLETKDSAICNIKPISIPAITNAKRRKDDIVITGKVDSVATIELFHTSGAPQTAEKFLGSTQTNADGDFTISVPFSLVGEKEKICFTATATYPCRATSNLSGPFCCESCFCTPDTTLLADTITVGESYVFDGEEVGGEISKAGLYNFVQKHENRGGCDSIVTLALAVRPQKRDGGYYVKTNGTGDGSSWSDAMGGGMLDTLLPLFPDGAEVFLAEGDYKTGEAPFKIAGRISLVGGFPKDAEEGAVSDPDVYVTTLTSAGKRKITNHYYTTTGETYSSDYEDHRPVVLLLTDGAEADLFGISVTGAYSCDSGAITMGSAKLSLDRCSVMENVSSAIVAGRGSEVRLKDSYFTLNFAPMGGVLRLEETHLEASGSLFEMNCATDEHCANGGTGGVAYLKGGYAQIENCTFANNSATEGGIFSIDGTELSLTNTTVSGAMGKQGSVFSAEGSANLSLWGNMIVGNEAGYCTEGIGTMVKEANYNITDEVTPWRGGGKDLSMQREELPSILDGKVNEGRFIPNTLFAGGYTKTIPVIASEFSGGKVLSLPHDDQRVRTDQRGFMRKDTCCIGAFEFPTLVNYHVKTHAGGDGSGRDWANAMDDTTFARHFQIVPSGATFHMAAGLYRPIFDNYGRKSDSRDRRYSTTRPVNIIGGYPAEAKEGDQPTPTTYHTVFSADFGGDDLYSVSNDEYAAISISNNKENAIHIISVSAAGGTCSFSGIELRGQACMPKGSSAAVEIYPRESQHINLHIEHCRFVGCYAGVYTTADTITVEDCRFDSIAGIGLSAFSPYQTAKPLFAVNGSSFSNTSSLLSTASMTGRIVIGNSTFGTSVQGITLPYSDIGTPSNTSVELYNNTFVGGKKTIHNILSKDYIPTTFVGNIFAQGDIKRNEHYGEKYEAIDVVSDYNIFTEAPSGYKLGEHDTIVPVASLAEVMDGQMNEGTFLPTLKEEKVVSQSIDLTNVKFSNGGSLKDIPAGATPVRKDQRGTRRPEDLYCRGAVEAECGFGEGAVKLIADKQSVGIGESVTLSVSGLSPLQANAFSLHWAADDEFATFTDTAATTAEVALRGKKNPVEISLTATNTCGEDSTFSLKIELKGVEKIDAEPFQFEYHVSDERCKGANNGRIKAYVRTKDNTKPEITLVCENIRTGEKRLVSYDGNIAADTAIRVENLAPATYHVSAYYGTPECMLGPAGVNDTIEILAMPNKLQFADEDSIRNAVCLKAKDAGAFFTAYGVIPGQNIKLLQDGKLICEVKYTVRKADTATYELNGLIPGDYTVKIEGVCSTVSKDFTVGGTQPYKAEVDSSKSTLKVRCPYDSTGVISAKYSGGADSCWCHLYIEDPASASGYRCISSIIIYKDGREPDLSHQHNKPTRIDYKQVDGSTLIEYGKLTKGNYLLRLCSKVLDCEDKADRFISITGPANVIMRKELLSVSCSGFHDGEISFKPRRSGVVSDYVISHDKREGYDIFPVFSTNASTNYKANALLPSDTAKYHAVEIEDGKIWARINNSFNETEYYLEHGIKLNAVQLDELKEKYPNLIQTDFVAGSFKWYKKSTAEKSWTSLNIERPEESDDGEDWYFHDSERKDTIGDVPVWSRSHLEEFWISPMGNTADLHAVSVANLSTGLYKVEFQDSVGCVYSDSFDIQKPRKELKIESIIYDKAGDCDPRRRYIELTVSGGWGDYSYSISDTLVKKNAGGGFDGYIGGEYVKTDNIKFEGKYRSDFLLPGHYSVRVADGHGCFVAEDTIIKVAENSFTAHSDTASVACPKAEDAEVVVNIEDDGYNGLYNIYEYASPCLSNEDKDCDRDSVALKVENHDGKTATLNFGGGTHGLFIYHVDIDGKQGCGTYFPAVVVDTLPLLRFFIDSIGNVSCHEKSTPIRTGLNGDGLVRFNLYGGTEPYSIYKNEVVNRDYKQNMVKVDDVSFQKDVDIENLHHATIKGLTPGKYFYTLKDGNGCMRYLGSDETFTETEVVIKQPTPIQATVTTSAICPRFDEQSGFNFVNKNGNVMGEIWSEFASGGTPFKDGKYQYSASKDGGDFIDSLFANRIAIPGEHGETPTMTYVITDSMGCELKFEDLRFKEDAIDINRIDFLVSKYAYKGDIYALIDLCGPEETFDSVSYSIDDPQYEILDRRMYVYDLDKVRQEEGKPRKDPDSLRSMIRSAKDTRAIPNGFFSSNFELRYKDSYLAKHINFIRLNDTTSGNTISSQDTVWKDCNIRMTAFFRGCPYTTEKMVTGTDIVTAYDNIELYDGGVSTGAKQIISVAASPNPYRRDGCLNVTIEFGERTEYDLHVYAMNGSAVYNATGQSSASGKFEDDKFTVKHAIPSTKFERNSQVYVILVTTKYDAEAILLLNE